MLRAIIGESFFNISPLDDCDLDYIQKFGRDGQRYLKRLADLDVEHWNALGLGRAVPPVQRVLRAIRGLAWLPGRYGKTTVVWIKRWEIKPAKFSTRLILNDGTRTPKLDLRPFFEG